MQRGGVAIDVMAVGDVDDTLLQGQRVSEVSEQQNQKQIRPHPCTYLFEPAHEQLETARVESSSG